MIVTANELKRTWIRAEFDILEIFVADSNAWHCLENGQGAHSVKPGLSAPTGSWVGRFLCHESGSSLRRHVAVQTELEETPSILQQTESAPPPFGAKIGAMMMAVL